MKKQPLTEGATRTQVKCPAASTEPLGPPPAPTPQTADDLPERLWIRRSGPNIFGRSVPVANSIPYRRENLLKPALLAALRQEVDRYPPDYNAFDDALAERWDYADTVNRLLAFLRRVVNEAG